MYRVSDKKISACQILDQLARHFIGCAGLCGFAGSVPIRLITHADGTVTPGDIPALRFMDAIRAAEQEEAP